MPAPRIVKRRKPLPLGRKSQEQLDAESAARHNARNEERWALWAAAGRMDLVAPPIDGAEVKRRRDEVSDHHYQHEILTRRRAEAYRAAVAELIGADELLSLDERRKRYPKGEEYAAELFCSTLSRLTGRTPLEIFEEFKERQDHASDMVRPQGIGLKELVEGSLRSLISQGGDDGRD